MRETWRWEDGESRGRGWGQREGVLCRRPCPESLVCLYVLPVRLLPAGERRSVLEFDVGRIGFKATEGDAPSANGPFKLAKQKPRESRWQLLPHRFQRYLSRITFFDPEPDDDDDCSRRTWSSTLPLASVGGRRDSDTETGLSPLRPHADTHKIHTATASMSEFRQMRDGDRQKPGPTWPAGTHVGGTRARITQPRT